MIKALDGEGNLILILTEENLTRLKNDQAVYINLEKMGNPKFGAIMIAYQPTVDVAIEKLKGAITANTKITFTDKPN